MSLGEQPAPPPKVVCNAASNFIVWNLEGEVELLDEWEKTINEYFMSQFKKVPLEGNTAGSQNLPSRRQLQFSGHYDRGKPVRPFAKHYMPGTDLQYKLAKATFKNDLGGSPYDDDFKANKPERVIEYKPSNPLEVPTYQPSGFPFNDQIDPVQISKEQREADEAKVSEMAKAARRVQMLQGWKKVNDKCGDGSSKDEKADA